MKGATLRHGRMAVKSVTTGAAGGVVAGRTTGWTHLAMKALPRRWLAGATVLTLLCVWILVLMLSSGSAGRQSQATYTAAESSQDAVTAMLADEAAMRSVESAGSRTLVRFVLSGAGHVASLEATAHAAIASDPALAKLVSTEQRLATEWTDLARAAIDSPSPAAFARQTRADARRSALVHAFEATGTALEADLVASRSAISANSREDALVLAGIFSALILLAAFGVLRGLGRADARMRALIDSSPDLITVVDGEHQILYQSPAFARMLGYTTGAPLGTPITHLLHPDDAPRMENVLREAHPGEGTGRAVECRWRHSDGALRWLETVGNNLLHDPKVGGIVLNSRDVTERRQLSEQLRKRAFHDGLTGLANREKLEERLERAIGRGGEALAVLFVDVDNFKTINDSLGHSAGDEVLGEVADRLTSCVRAGDLVARMGGDEFAVLLAGLDASARAPRIAERILRELAIPLQIDQRPISLSASIGIASGGSVRSAQEILRDSDLALYEAKRAGKGQAQIYRPFMHAAALEQLELEADLRVALERGELALHYQPLFRLADGELVGYEALLRWDHPTRGMLLPGTFIDLAEQTGLIVPVTRWALTTACQQTAVWQEQARRPLEIAVNLSFLNLRDDTILRDVSSALESSSVEPEKLVLEITEGNLMRLDMSRQILCDLKDLGVRLALDDFGTGYSSLARLSQLPFDSLKIPRPFVERITHSNTNFALAQGIVDLGHRLDLSIVAEGIETPNQLARVRAIGCELAQGFHLATPAAAQSTNVQKDMARRETIALSPPQAPEAGGHASLKLVRGAGGSTEPLPPSAQDQDPGEDEDPGKDVRAKAPAAV